MREGSGGSGVRRISATLALLAVCAAGLTALAGTAGAQQGPPCDPAAYGCPPPPPPRPTEPTITVRPAQSQVGRTVGVDACGYRPADDGLSGSITFDGEPVLAVTLDDTGCLRPGQPSNGLSNSFVVPNRPPGTYQVCAVFPGYPAACTAFRVFAPGNSGGGSSGGGNDARVLQATETRAVATEGVSGAGGERARSGPGSLARTGLGVAALLVAGTALVVGGRALSRRS